METNNLALAKTHCIWIHKELLNQRIIARADRACHSEVEREEGAKDTTARMFNFTLGSGCAFSLPLVEWQILKEDRLRLAVFNIL